MISLSDLDQIGAARLEDARVLLAASRFEGYASFRTHDLEVLLRLSGQETNIKQNHFLLWNPVALWNPEARYKAIGSAPKPVAEEMVDSADALLKVL